MKYLLLALLLLASPVLATDYAQLSSANDQFDSQIRAEIIDGIKGLIYEDYAVEIQDGGDYFIVVAPQTGTLKGCSDYWLEVNGIQVLNSNIRICQTQKKQTMVGVAQAILKLVAGDKITFHQSGDLGVNAIVVEDEPLIPAVIISVFQL